MLVKTKIILRISPTDWENLKLEVFHINSTGRPRNSRLCIRDFRNSREKNCDGAFKFACIREL